MAQNPNPRSGGRARGVASTGTMRFARRELLKEIKQQEGGAFVVISPTDFPFAKAFTKIFDRYKIHRFRVIYRPSCGSTTSGSVIFGVDWDAKKMSAVSYKTIATLTPILDVPLWQSGELELPASRLMTRKEYMISDDSTDGFDSTPGYLCFAASGDDATKIAGHLWVDYDISFFGTKTE